MQVKNFKIMIMFIRSIQDLHENCLKLKTRPPNKIKYFGWSNVTCEQRLDDPGVDGKKKR